MYFKKIILLFLLTINLESNLLATPTENVVSTWEKVSKYVLLLGGALGTTSSFGFLGRKIINLDFDLLDPETLQSLITFLVSISAEGYAIKCLCSSTQKEEGVEPKPDKPV